MKKVILGTATGAGAGVIDVIPMFIQGLPMSANLSAFSMWVLLGFLINSSTLKINYVLKGVLLSLIVVTPTTIVIGAAEPMALIPIYIMTLILGTLLGFLSGKIDKIA